MTTTPLPSGVALPSFVLPRWRQPLQLSVAGGGDSLPTARATVARKLLPIYQRWQRFTFRHAVLFSAAAFVLGATLMRFLRQRFARQQDSLHTQRRPLHFRDDEDHIHKATITIIIVADPFVAQSTWVSALQHADVPHRILIAQQRQTIKRAARGGLENVLDFFRVNHQQEMADVITDMTLLEKYCHTACWVVCLHGARFQQSPLALNNIRFCSHWDTVLLDQMTHMGADRPTSKFIVGTQGVMALPIVEEATQHAAPIRILAHHSTTTAVLRSAPTASSRYYQSTCCSEFLTCFFSAPSRQEDAVKIECLRTIRQYFTGAALTSFPDNNKAKFMRLPQLVVCHVPSSSSSIIRHDDSHSNIKKNFLSWLTAFATQATDRNMTSRVVPNTPLRDDVDIDVWCGRYKKREAATLGLWHSFMRQKWETKEILGIYGTLEYFSQQRTAMLVPAVPTTVAASPPRIMVNL